MMRDFYSLRKEQFHQKAIPFLTLSWFRKLKENPKMPKVIIYTQKINSPSFAHIPKHTPRSYKKIILYEYLYNNSTIDLIFAEHGCIYEAMLSMWLQKKTPRETHQAGLKPTSSCLEWIQKIWRYFHNFHVNDTQQFLKFVV